MTEKTILEQVKVKVQKVYDNILPSHSPRFVIDDTCIELSVNETKRLYRKQFMEVLRAYGLSEEDVFWCENELRKQE